MRVRGKLHGGRLCTRCALAGRLAGLLDDGTGAIRPELAPLADALLAMDNPLSGLTWLYPRQGRSGSADDLLRRLGRGEIQLTHEAFNGLQPWRAASHLRDLLMACGVLPAIDKQLCAFERWLDIHLATVHRQRPCPGPAPFHHLGGPARASAPGQRRNRSALAREATP